MYIYFIYAYIHTCACIYRYVHISFCNVFKCLHAYVPVCLPKYLYTYMQKCIHIYVYMHVYNVYVCAYMSGHIHTYKQTLTCMHSWMSASILI